jgi:hypothetical protein
MQMSKVPIISGYVPRVPVVGTRYVAVNIRLYECGHEEVKDKEKEMN